MSETKKLRGACIGYLNKKGHDIVALSKVGLFCLLRLVAQEHAKEMGSEVTVSYHFEGDNR